MSMADRRYPSYQYSPPQPAMSDRYGRPVKPPTAGYPVDRDEIAYRRYEEETHPAYSRSHGYASSSRHSAYDRSRPAMDYRDDYPDAAPAPAPAPAPMRSRMAYDDDEERRRPYLPATRQEEEAYYRREEAARHYPRGGAHEPEWDRSWDRGIQPSYRRSARSPEYMHPSHERASFHSREYVADEPPLPAASRRFADEPPQPSSPPRPSMSISNMLNEGAANGSPPPPARRSLEETHISPSRPIHAGRESRSAYDPTRDYSSRTDADERAPAGPLADRSQYGSSKGRSANYRDYSPDEDDARPIKEEGPTRGVPSIANLLDGGNVDRPLRGQELATLPPPPRRRSSSRLEAARTLERLGNQQADDLDARAPTANGSNGEGMASLPPNDEPLSVNGNGAKQASGKHSLKLRNNPLPPSKDKPSFYAPPPPSKRSRDADGWESDLSTEENRPVWQAELDVYLVDMADRKRMIEQSFYDSLDEKQAEVGARLASAYEGRHFAMMRRVKIREQQEAAQAELRRREREDSVRKMREREIEAELLGTLNDGSKGRKGGRSRNQRADDSANEGDELEDDDDLSIPSKASRGIKVKRSKTKPGAAAISGSKKRRLDEGQPESSPAGSDTDVPLAELDDQMDASTVSRFADLDDSVFGSRQVSPSLADDSAEPMALDAKGKVPIDARRAQQLEDAHKRIWTTIAKRDVPKVYRTMLSSASSKAMYWRRLSSVVQREAKRGAARNNKTVKDVQARARKVMREVLVFWKRNEKEERELRKKAEKEALEKAKKEEEMREAKRQARKLNFLISQTELYSHFVGSKLKTAEAEESEETAGGSKPGAGPEVDPHLAVTEAEAKLAELDEIDFDDEDESNLRAHAARNAQEAVRMAKEKAAAFDAAAAEERRRNEAAAAELAAENGEEPPAGGARILEKDLGKAFDSDDMNFLNPTSMGQMQVKQPKMLTCQLKEYQLKGLNWLANLYEQGINGILADEMGLGKTVQSISLMAYLAEVHDIWGPFLVIAPASTLHNWQQEITKFVPSLKALPYWGNVKDRAVLRKFWNRKQISYNRDAPFHVLVTSYQLVVSDEKYFQRVKWQYMILDEAQAIKSSSSIRWKTLLGFNCRNRLLLTGTPVQNSMQELWALLHFIMPSLFDSHDEFSEWFSKDIESHAENKGTLNEHQLRRLHMILKPFMLRRIKKNVQNELGEKIEIDVFCDMSARQKMLYKGLRSHISVAELMDKATSNDEAGLKSLMNLVMQFRKVCNHPELFERADVRAPFAFASFAQSGSLAREGDSLNLPDSTSSLIEYRIPKLLVREGGLVNIPGEKSRKGFDTGYLDNLLNIWRSPHVAKSLELSQSAFAFLPLLGLTPNDVEKAFHSDGTTRLLTVAEAERRIGQVERFACDDDFAAAQLRPLGKLLTPLPANSGLAPSLLMPLGEIVTDYCHHSILAKDSTRASLAPAVAPPIRLYCNDGPFMQSQEELRRDPRVSAALFGLSPEARESEERVEAMQRVLPGVPPQGLMPNSSLDQLPHNAMQVPQMNKLIVDSSKLARLDSLLRELKAGGHRVLIYFQMTKMIDLMEEYLIYRQYKYLRLDGASKISDRRDMVTDWQTKPELFIFLLSTRAGGLGINLTAADTVIFYDHDWNPSNDSQAMDRAHRLGQTKQVTVYRLITKGTIDERIVRLARNKKEVQDIVVGTKAYSETGMAKPQEIVSLLLDDDELAESMLRRKQAEEAQTAQEKADSARAMHARRRLNKDKAAAAQSPAPSGLDWSLEDDEDDL